MFHICSSGFWFSNLTCFVVWKSMMSDAFRVTCGVHQGGILSPILFSVYTERYYWENETVWMWYLHWYSVCWLYIVCRWYCLTALVSCSCHGLQKLIDICQHYGYVCDIKFNATKSQAITFGGNHPKCTLKLDIEEYIQSRQALLLYRLHMCSTL